MLALPELPEVTGGAVAWCAWWCGRTAWILMPEIPDIDIRNVEIRDVSIPNWMVTPPSSIPPVVPITQQVGVPVIDIPGCAGTTPRQ